jgi:energy-coupling factor transport system permease protein
MNEAPDDERDEAAADSTPADDRAPSRAPLHPVAWLIWVLGVLIVLTMTRNPWYLAMILGCVGAVLTTRGRTTPTESVGQALALPLRIGLVMVLFSALFNALMVHVGGAVLFSVPDWVPLLGGRVTLEAFVYGALNGAALAGIFAAFTALNRALPVRSLLRLVPRAYYPLAVVMTIAVTFVPATIQYMQQIREAQAVRGRQMQGARSWLPLVVPLLEGGIERSMQLAEAMMARGFAGGEAAPDPRPQGLMLAGLVAVLAGWLLRLAWRAEAAGALLLLAGLAAVVGGLWLAGRRHPHTVYRPEQWAWRDGIVVGGAVVAAAVYLAPWPGLDRSTLFYYPYPSLSWPGFDPIVGAATLGLALPAVV